jgi:putative N-acetylmannosamine-6-phosphate epimerase
VTGHPSALEGDIGDIAEQAATVSRFDGVTGIDLLAYRHETADTADLIRAVVAATSGPVIAAGSVRSAQQIETLAKAGAWGFTIGSAIFDGQLPGAPGLRAQVVEVLKLAGTVGS